MTIGYLFSFSEHSVCLQPQVYFCTALLCSTRVASFRVD